MFMVEGPGRIVKVVCKVNGGEPDAVCKRTEAWEEICFLAKNDNSFKRIVIMFLSEHRPQSNSEFKVGLETGCLCMIPMQSDRTFPHKVNALFAAKGASTVL